MEKEKEETKRLFHDGDFDNFFNKINQNPILKIYLEDVFDDATSKFDQTLKKAIILICQKDVKLALKQIDRLKTKPLQIAYKQIIKKLEQIDEVGVLKKLETGYHEKMRFYAKRIANTEKQRALTAKRAKEYLDDKDVEYVRFNLSSSHKMVDVCDFYANLDIGYGAGVVKKEDMRTLPLHPFCNCFYEPYYPLTKEKAKFKRIKEIDFRTAQVQTIQKFSEFNQKNILGSTRQFLEFKHGKDIEAIFNTIRDEKYHIRKYVDVFKKANIFDDVTVMKKVFNEISITHQEKEAIIEWIKDSSEIKKVMWGY
jgi:hypothetical protein